MMLNVGVPSEYPGMVFNSDLLIEIGSVSGTKLSVRVSARSSLNTTRSIWVSNG